MWWNDADGDPSLGISLKLEIGGDEKSAAAKVVDIVDGDDFKLTCRANKVLAKAPLNWTLNNGPLNTTVKEAWGMVVSGEQF